MQDKKPSESLCHYPDCTSPAVKTCRKCHQSFCDLHIHRRWWSYMCEFCLLLKAAERPVRTTSASKVIPSTDAVIDQVREKNHQEQIDELAN